MNSKTHWLQSPNKNYLGHWDLPNGDDFIVTIESAKWEEVKNPITNKSEAKRVIRFSNKGVKPMICNQTNAQAIIKSTGVKFMEDSKGAKIQLYVGQHKDRQTKEFVDCIRIRREVLIKDDEQIINIQSLLAEKRDKLTESEITGITRVIDNKEKISYLKVINFLNTK